MTDSTNLPDPPVPADCDLRDYRFMPLEVARLRRSKAWLICRRRPQLGFYMVNLWAASWHEVPAASLEDDDDVLCDAAMCSPETWQKVKADVLRGWVKCSDGRIYHPVVAEKALEGWETKNKQRKMTSAATTARLNKLKGIDQRDVNVTSTSRSPERQRNEHVTFTKGQGRDREGKKEIHSATTSPSLPRDAAVANAGDQVSQDVVDVVAMFEDERAEAFPTIDKRRRWLPADAREAGWILSLCIPDALIRQTFRDGFHGAAMNFAQPPNGLAWFRKRFEKLGLGGSMPPPQSPTTGHGAQNGGHSTGEGHDDSPADAAWYKDFKKWQEVPYDQRGPRPNRADYAHLNAQKAS